ncbi:MAG: hypothetical protein MJ238_04835 [Bacilli bacterium]|nr:hypothetical protein [Bacilli bacterium]
MNLFKDIELFSMQVSTLNKDKKEETCLINALYRNAIYTVRNTNLVVVDEKQDGHAYKLNPNAFRAVEDYINKVSKAFNLCPSELHVEGILRTNDFVFLIGGKMFRGNFAIFPDSLMSDEETRFSKQEKRKMKWNNEVVKFSQTITKMLDSYGMKGALRPVEDAPELAFLKPSTREYISSFKTSVLHDLAEPTPRDVIIKKAIREALPSDMIPQGQAFSSIVSLIKEKAIPAIKEAKSERDFDNKHSSICEEIILAIGDGYDFIDASRILDYFYLFMLLLEDELHSEKELKYLHFPVTKEQLIREGVDLNKTEYLYTQFTKRNTPTSAPLLTYLNSQKFDEFEDGDETIFADA